MMQVIEEDAAPAFKLDHRRITLRVRPGTRRVQREAIYQRWQRGLLHQVVPPLIARWQTRLGVKVNVYFLQRMKTKWGACNPARAHLRLNTELVKKPRDLLEYVVVHELAHLIEPSHNARFIAVLDQHYPIRRDARAELNLSGYILRRLRRFRATVPKEPLSEAANTPRLAAGKFIALALAG